MSSGLSKVAGSSATINLRGRDYQVRPITFGDFAAIEQHLRDRRGNIISRLGNDLKALDPDVRKEIIQAAIDKMDARPNISPEESGKFLNSFEGVVYAFWLLMKTQHPELETPEQVGALMNDMPIDALFDTFERVSGLADLKNSVGPAVAVDSRAEATALTTDPHEYRGQSSISG